MYVILPLTHQIINTNNLKPKKMKNYHVGLYQSKRTAVFQYRENVDLLSCELLKYYGIRIANKEQVRANMRVNKVKVLHELNTQYPKRNFKAIKVD